MMNIDDALRILRASFIIRSPEDAFGVQGFRTGPNTRPLLIRATPDGPIIGMPHPVASLETDKVRDSAFPDGTLHCYRIQDQEALLAAISTMTQPVLPAPAPIPTPVAPSPLPQTATAMPEATNTILYGPPGTGKTYATQRWAVQLCDGEAPADAALLRSRYEALRDEGRITFVTFHQSYGYEEFIEGLRPTATESGQVAFGVVAGAFKRACAAARRPARSASGVGVTSLRERRAFKMSLGAISSGDAERVFRYCVQNGYVLLGWGDDIDFTDCPSREAIEACVDKVRPGSDDRKSMVRFVECFKHELQIGDLIVASKGNGQVQGIAEVTGAYEFVKDAPYQQGRRVRWLALFDPPRQASEFYGRELVQSTLYRLDSELIRFDALEDAVSETEGSAVNTEGHVFVIDEINRANISKVFGELITLIESDKREGAANAIRVRLPYSGESFGVPGNLHVLGTMNTADRSIALLDTALRRRFDFVEVMPDPDVLAGRVIDGIDLSRLLRELNERIERLYDRDHTIGHAYFMSVDSLARLDTVFRRKVLPLLQEYFFEDWSKVRRVLNDTAHGEFVQRIDAPGVQADPEAFDEAPNAIYRLNAAPFPVQAYRRIYGG